MQPKCGRCSLPTILLPAALAVTLVCLNRTEAIENQQQAEKLYYVCRMDRRGAEAVWRVRNFRTQDGQTIAMLCSDIPGQPAAGRLRSETFFAAETLSFYLAGYSRDPHAKLNLVRLMDAETHRVLQSQNVPDRRSPRRYRWNLADITGRAVYLELIDADTDTTRGWIAFGCLQPEVVTMPGLADANLPGDWTDGKADQTEIRVSQIPFLKTQKPPIIQEGKSWTLNDLSISAGLLYVLGCKNSIDQPNPGWGGTQDYRNFFVGDSLGNIRLTYASGTQDSVALIYGYNVWWGQNYQQYHRPFSNNPHARQTLDAALCVANGLDGYKDAETNYFTRIALRKEALASIAFEDNPAKAGHINIEGLTFADVHTIGENPNPRLIPISSHPPDEKIADWLRTHTIAAANPLPPSRRSALRDLAGFLYTYRRDITYQTIQNTPIGITTHNFPGPDLQFFGCPEAEILTRVYFDNANEIRLRVDANGLIHESKKDAEYYWGFGTWKDDFGAFYNTAYTRNRSLIVLGRLGFEKAVSRGIDFFDHWLMYFPNAFPKLQLGGKPVPGHATVIANQPHVYFDTLRHAGWATKYTSRDFGNPENDGHGIQMLSHWRKWNKTGRSEKWIRERWPAINEAAEYIRWALDNPELSFSEHGLLYSESEGGMQMESLYCDMPCYLGLLAYAQMAEAVGREQEALRWRDTAEQMRVAMDRYYPKTIPPFGDVWDPNKSANWKYGQGTLAPILFAVDFYGPDACKHLPPDWLSRTKRSYEMALTNIRPAFCAPGGLGYGQDYFAQTALLLDRMDEASKWIDWLARFCFAPRHPHPYRVPEGLVVKSDGSAWRRWGDLGNLYQMNETIYTLLTIAGICDLNPDYVLIMPRLPGRWTQMHIENYPLRTTSRGQNTTLKMDMACRLSRDSRTIECTLRTDRPVDQWRIRLGPLPTRARDVASRCNGKDLEGLLVTSGDSKWFWLTISDFDQTELAIHTTWR